MLPGHVNLRGSIPNDLMTMMCLRTVEGLSPAGTGKRATLCEYFEALLIVGSIMVAFYTKLEPFENRLS